MKVLKAIGLSSAIFIELVLCVTVYAAGSNTEIDQYISRGNILNNKLQRLEQQYLDLQAQKTKLNSEGIFLSNQQKKYEEQAGQYNQKAGTHNQIIANTGKTCRSSGPKKNLDQLAQSADNAEIGFSNYGSNSPDTVQQQEYVRKCRNRITYVNSATSHMRVEKTSMLMQQLNLDSQSVDYDAKTLAWNQKEVQTVNALNHLYSQLNAWENASEDFMASDYFQHRIIWAHAQKTCRAPVLVGSGRQRLTTISDYIMHCMSRVERSP